MLLSFFPNPNDTKGILFHKRSRQTQRATPIVRISPPRRRHTNVQPRQRIQHRTPRMRTANPRKRLKNDSARRNNLRRHRPQLHQRTPQACRSSIGVAIPSGKNQYGYLSEHHTFGQTDETAGDYAEDLAATMLATTMGIQFDPETAWDERKQLFKTTGLIIKTANITQSRQATKTACGQPQLQQPSSYRQTANQKNKAFQPNLAKSFAELRYFSNCILSPYSKSCFCLYD